MKMKWITDSKEGFLAQAIALGLEARPFAQAAFLGRAVSIGILTMEQAEETWKAFGFGPARTYEPLVLVYETMIRLAQREAMGNEC